MAYYIYLLENRKDGSWYIGYTSNLNKRIREHNHNQGGKTTKNRGSWKLIYSEIYINKLDAVGRELFLKSGSGRKYLKKQLKHYLTK
jgi:putative endonuclease